MTNKFVFENVTTGEMTDGREFDPEAVQHATTGSTGVLPETPEDDRMHPLDPCEQCAEAVMPEREPASAERMEYHNYCGACSLDMSPICTSNGRCMWSPHLDAQPSSSSLDVSQVEALIATWQNRAQEYLENGNHIGFDLLTECADDLTALLRGGRPTDEEKKDLSRVDSPSGSAHGDLPRRPTE